LARSNLTESSPNPKEKSKCDAPIHNIATCKSANRGGFAIAPLKRRNKFRDLVIFFVDVGSGVGSNSW
jgi:hypothetical protein